MVTPITLVDLDIINMALTGDMGERRINDLANEAAPKGIIMREKYENVSETAQTKTAWRFNTTKVALSKLSGVPLNRWAAAWQLPTDLLKVLTTWPPTRYEIQGKRLYTNDTSQVHLDYTRKLSEGEWPPWFVRYVVSQLVLRTIKGIRGDEASDDMKEEAADALTDALFQDAQQQPNQTMQSNAFIDARL